MQIHPFRALLSLLATVTVTVGRRAIGAAQRCVTEVVGRVVTGGENRNADACPGQAAAWPSKADCLRSSGSASPLPDAMVAIAQWRKHPYRRYRRQLARVTRSVSSPLGLRGRWYLRRLCETRRHESSLRSLPVTPPRRWRRAPCVNTYLPQGAAAGRVGCSSIDAVSIFSGQPPLFEAGLALTCVYPIGDRSL